MKYTQEFDGLVKQLVDNCDISGLVNLFQIEETSRQSVIRGIKTLYENNKESVTSQLASLLSNNKYLIKDITARFIEYLNIPDLSTIVYEELTGEYQKEQVDGQLVSTLTWVLGEVIPASHPDINQVLTFLNELKQEEEVNVRIYAEEAVRKINQRSLTSNQEEESDINLKQIYNNTQIQIEKDNNSTTENENSEGDNASIQETINNKEQITKDTLISHQENEIVFGQSFTQKIEELISSGNRSEPAMLVMYTELLWAEIKNKRLLWEQYRDNRYSIYDIASKGFTLIQSWNIEEIRKVEIMEIISELYTYERHFDYPTDSIDRLMGKIRDILFMVRAELYINM